MKISITGHTSGIGLSMFKQLEQRGHEIIGFSRSNGFDISDPDAQQQIVDMSKDADIFFNNAHSGFGQTELFTKLWKEWRLKNKIIVNTGSITTTFRQGADRPWHPLGRAHYAAEKAALDMAVSWAWNDAESFCEAILIKPGFVATPRVKQAPAELSMIDPDNLAQFVVQCVLDQPFVVRELIINTRK